MKIIIQVVKLQLNFIFVFLSLLRAAKERHQATLPSPNKQAVSLLSTSICLVILSSLALVQGFAGLP